MAEEISPAAMANNLCYSWLTGDSSISNTQVVHRIVSTTDPLPEEFTVTLFIKKCEKPEYCMFGLTEKIMDIKEKSYLGNTDLGVVGFAFSNVTACENDWKWHNTKANEGDYIKIVGNKKKVQIYTNDKKVQSLDLLKPYEELYLACHLYGVCEFEIIEVLSTAEFTD